MIGVNGTKRVKTCSSCLRPRPSSWLEVGKRGVGLVGILPHVLTLIVTFA